MTIENLPQQKIKVDVDYYNEEDKKQLLKLLGNDPSIKVIEEFVANGTEISVADFLFLFLFHLLGRGNPYFQTRERIIQNLRMGLTFLDGWVEWDGRSIRIRSTDTDPTVDFREHIGEGIGLAVASQIHGLTPTDWTRIIPGPGKGNIPRFDFEIASTGNRYIQVENKGSVVIDNRDSRQVSYHNNKIKEKKQSIANRFPNDDYPFPASLRYGIIVALDPRYDGNVKCWLVDPPAEKIQYTPERFKLLSRMHFLRDWISFISPNSQLASSITVRVAELEVLPDPFVLDDIPLRDKTGKIFRSNIPFIPFPGFPLLSKFFSKKSRIVGGPTGGVVFQLSDNELFFIGIFQEHITNAINQDFTKILRYSHKSPGSITKTVECVFSRSEFMQLRLPPSIFEHVEEKKNIIRFYLSGQIHFSSTGLVFGILPLKYR